MIRQMIRFPGLRRTEEKMRQLGRELQRARREAKQLEDRAKADARRTQ